MPEGLSTSAAETARESIANATAVAAGLPAGEAAALLDLAQDAYTTAMNIVAAVGAVVAVVLSLVAFIRLRDTGAPTAAPSEPAPAPSEPAPMDP